MGLGLGFGLGDGEEKPVDDVWVWSWIWVEKSNRMIRFGLNEGGRDGGEERSRDDGGRRKEESGEATGKTKTQPDSSLFQPSSGLCLGFKALVLRVKCGRVGSL